MTIAAKSSILYDDLKNTVLNNILALVKNRDAYDGSVPPEIKPGWSYTYTISRTGEPGTYPCYYTFTLGADDYLNVVSTQTIIDEFNNFLESRGLTSKSNALITSKGIINFFNNVAAFCSVKLILVTSQFTGTEVIFYNAVDQEIPTVPVADDDVPITSANITDMLANLNTTLNSVTRLHMAKYTTSSSSCSSSSSSSSAYIAYFNLN